MSIKATGIVKRFGDFLALDNVDLAVESGRLTALLGPSGGGKSTLLRIIGGLEEPDDGSVQIDGVEATGVPAQRRNVGFVFQHYAAFKHLSVYRNVAFGLEIRKRPKDEIRRRVGELLDLVHLAQFADRLPSQLSGGQRQRMALARALAVEPKVLLLDEPFGALDAKVRKELRDWLRRLHDEVHVTTVFVTHDQEEALEVSDELVVINNGRIEQVGSPDELYDRPGNEFVMGFLGPVTRLAGQLVRPHDIEVFTERVDGTQQAEVTRLQRIGYEVRAETRSGSSEPWVQLTRGQAEALGLRQGSTVWLRAAPHAATLSLQHCEGADLGEDGLRGTSVAESGGPRTSSGEGGRSRIGTGTAP
jgi:sulfate transport system ATP-binding protein